MHPRISSLIAFSDAEPGTGRYRRIAGHVSRCEKCQGRMQRIEDEKRALSLQAMDLAPDPPQPDMKGLFSSMSAWSQGQTAGLEARIQHRVREQLDIYLGSQAISLLERPELPTAELLARSGEVLETLLGPMAGDAVRDEMLSGMNCARAAAETER